MMIVEDKHKQVWNNCLHVIKDIIPPDAFKTWFEPIVPLKLVNNVLTIEVKSTFIYEYIEGNFLDLLKPILRKELGNSAKLEYSIKVLRDGNPVKLPSTESAVIGNRGIPYPPPKNRSEIRNPFVIPGLKKLEIDPQLNLKYSFSNFVEGDCNRLGITAGMAIAEKPGSTAFNPFFVYGHSGLGKTHLAQAIGIEIKKNSPDKIVLYIDASRFQQQYTDATIRNNLNDFLYFYQMIDVLILDDVHEFAGKTGTQNAFFHIFNHLCQLQKQLILTSDKPPVELQGLEPRLLSRFKCGLLTELKSPDLQTRIQILKHKIYNDGLNIDEKVINLLASRITDNIRELEGVLISLLAQPTFMKQEITIELAEEMLDKLVSAKPEKTIHEIKQIVCEYFNMQSETVLSQTRKREIVQVRQIIMYLCKNNTTKSLSMIGAEMGNRDHTTVLYAWKTIRNLIETDKAVKSCVNDLEKLIM
jgi:chromosomal replication initiator protein